jgi:hypothetical protein
MRAPARLPGPAQEGVGETGIDPRSLPLEDLAAVHAPAPLLDVIREKCLDCSGYRPAEILRCSAVACSCGPTGWEPTRSQTGKAMSAPSRRGAPARAPRSSRGKFQGADQAARVVAGPPNGSPCAEWDNCPGQQTPRPVLRTVRTITESRAAVRAAE